MSALEGSASRVSGAVREAVGAWALAFGAIVVAFLVARSASQLVATACFLFIPLYLARRRGEELSDYGLTLRFWRADLKLFAIVAGALVPTFFLASWGFYLLLPHLPAWLSTLLFPTHQMPRIHLALPPRFGRTAALELLVVALPEELFYRGFIQTRLRDAWPKGALLWGGRLGPAFFATAALFAFGHLAIFEFWRLAVFFPALLFGWMRERTGTVVGSTLLHAFCNVYQMLLFACFFGP